MHKKKQFLRNKFYQIKFKRIQLSEAVSSDQSYSDFEMHNDLGEYE